MRLSELLRRDIDLLNEKKSNHYYHGSRNDHQSFDVSHIGVNSHTFGDYSSIRYGIFFTTNPKFAGLYGDVYEYDLAINNTINLHSNKGKDIIYSFLETLQYNRNLYIGVQNILHTGRNIWTLFEDDIGKLFVKYLKSLKYDSATFIEYNTDDTGKEHKSETYVVFNPANVIKNNQYELNLFENNLPDYIDYKGKQVSTKNSEGDYIGNNIEAIESFYNWFGNSKIVDSNNRPLVVYHGGSFNKAVDKTFDTTHGIHFGTLNAAQQRLYDKPVDDFVNNAVIEYDDNYKSFYWKSNNIDSYDIDPDGFKTEKEARLNLQDYALGYGEVYEDNSSSITSAYLKIINPVRTKDQKDNWNNTILKVKSIMADGIIYKNEFEDKGKNSYIVFNPKQIKIL